MPDDEGKAIALDYLMAFDNGGVRPRGGSILDLFAEAARVYFPEWGRRHRKD
jgi:hypothetical protein